MHLRTLARRLLSLVLVSAFALTLVPPVASAAEPLPEIAGSGTEEEPFLIGSAADLLAVTAAINAHAEYGDQHYRLTSDIDLDGASFPGIDRFTGVLDGAGHRIANLTYGEGTDGHRGLIRQLDGGAVRDLTIDGLTVHVEEQLRVAGIAVNASGGAVIEGNSVINADLSTGQQYVAAFVNDAREGVTVRDNWAHGSFTSERYPSAVVGYARYDVDIERNLVEAVVTATGNQAVGGMVLGYTGAYSRENAESHVRHNVLLDGAVTWHDGQDRLASGRVLGHVRSPGYVIEDNLANETITVGGERPEAPGEGNKHGTDTAPQLLAQQQTYTDLGWDLEQTWRWDAELSRPVPARAAQDLVLDELPVPFDPRPEQPQEPEEPEEPVDPDEPAPSLPDIAGDGTADAPFQIATAADLRTVADAINGDNARYGGLHYVLAANIDFAGAAFTGIDEFRGVLDGAGHKIFDITYGPGADSDERALFRTLTGATVKNLTLDGVRAAVTQASQVAGITINATGGTVIDGNSVINAELSSGHQYVAAIAANAQRGVTVTNNWVQGSFRSARYPAAVVGYGRYGVEIRNNLVDAHVTAGGARAHGGMLLSYQGAYNEDAPGRVSENVLLGGKVDWRGASTVDAGRVLGIFRDEGFVVEKNLANETITVGSERPDAPGAGNRNGTDTAPELLAQQQTYEDLGWDFENQWRWDEGLGHPVPHRAFLLGEGTEAAPFEIRAPSDLEFLAERINGGDRSLLGGKHVELLGDLDLTGRAPFVGIDTFDGVLDGRGHTVTGLTYGPSEASAALGLVRDLSGTVRNLTLDGVRADGGDRTEPVAGLAVNLVGTVDRPARVERVQLVDAEVSAPAADVAGGVAATATNAVVVRNTVDVSVTAARAAGGILGTLGDGVDVTLNLVEAAVAVLTDGGAGTEGVDAGLVGAVPGTGSTITRNVALDGAIDYAGAIGGFAGRIAGYTGHDGWTAEENLANVEITIGGETVSGPGTKNQHGTDVTPAQLADKATYERLGWSFTDDWRWDPTAGRPLLKYVLPEEYPNRITTTFYGDPATQRAFTWYHSIETDAPAVLLSTDESLAPDATELVAATQHEGAHGETVHQAVATALEPDTTYYYRVGDSTSEVWSATGTFRTASGTGDFTFIDLTDTQAKASTEAALAANTMRKALAAVPEAEFMVHNGDVVQDGDVEQDWVDMLGAAQDSLLATTIAPASGNHDMAPQAFVDHFMLEHPNEQDTTTGAYYSYTYNGAHFMVLNTNEDAEQAITDEQLAWLEQDAAAAREAGADWLILTMHKGVYTAGNHADDSDILAMREVLVPVVDELEIDLVLQGHDHYMSRTQVLEHDPDGVEGAGVVETTKITEVVNGQRIEYHLDPEGTIYFMPNTAGAKHYQQIDETDHFDLEAYLRLFDRLGTPRAGNVETFSSVDVTEDRLTVEVFQIRDGGAPTRVEGFGIDRQISPVEELLAGLPDPADATLDDAPAVAAARAAVDELTRDQQRGLTGLASLAALELRMRELTGLVSTDGDVVAWADPAATSRQAIEVRNDTRRDFTDAPVRLTIAGTPEVAADQLTLTSADGAPLSHEVEHWEPGATSTVWVRLPLLAAGSTTSVWAYYGGGDATNDPTDVWSGGYALVEHFDQDTAAGEQRVDSTGQHTGTLVGGDLTATPADGGTLESRFAGSRLQYPGDVGGGFGTLTVSGVYSFTPEDLAALDGGDGAIVAKQRVGEDAAFFHGVAPDGSVKAYRGGSTPTVRVPADGEPHLVTQVYDGMTSAVFVDGVEQYQGQDERSFTASDHGVLTTIGDVDSGDGTLATPFHGSIDEVQIAGFGFLPEFEAFRYANYVGDAVTYGAQVERGDEPLSLVVGGPAGGTEVEAGPVTFSGSLSERAVVTATVAGREVLSETVDAGSFALDVPVFATGSQRVTLSARRVTDEDETSGSVVELDVTDTVAPTAPTVEESGVEPGATEVALKATPRSEQAEPVEVTFHANEAVAVDESNVVVRTGTTTDRVPTALTPQSGEATGELLPTTVAEDANPFQIYEITLTEEQAAEEELHLSWSGTGDDRRVSAWVYDHGAGQWLLKDSDHDADGGTLALDVTARAEENVVDDDGAMHVLVWRGLVEEPWGDRVHEQYPDGADFDWAFNHVPDTQLYAEATPWMMLDMFEHLVANAEERKTELVLHAGDWVNREYLDDEYQWSSTIRSAELLEEAELPYMVSWGNHDYSLERNGRLMLQKYFPMSRFEQSVEGTPFEFGGSHDIDNFYYTADIDGADLLFLAVGFWSAEDDGAAGLAWAQDVIEAHPDHTIILATHHHLVARYPDAPFSNQRINDLLVDPYPNVVLTLSGHNSGSFVTARETDHGNQSYGILTDYQTRPWGGHEFYKNISVDAENGLLYVNTYSPWLDSWISDGRWHSPISEDKVPGFHGDDSENFVLELDLGGQQRRTLAASGLTLAVGAPTQVGEPVTVVGSEPASVTFTGIEPGTTYEWYVDVADDGGNVTRSATSQFVVAAAEPEEPTEEPTDPSEPEEPTEEPTDPSEPEEPTEEPTDPTEPEEPGQPQPDRRTAEFHLSNSWRGSTDVHFMYGRWADEVLIGDWDGDGKDTIAVRRGNVFHVSNAQQGGDADAVITYGRPGDTILVGDWDGDGTDTFAVRRGNTYHVKNSMRGGDADAVFHYGRENDAVMVGDWDGNGTDTFAVRRAATYHVKNSLRGGDADTVFTYGRAGDVTLAGDWDGDGRDTFTVRRGATYHVSNSLRGGAPDTVVTFGRAGDEVHVGDWDGNGTDTLGVRRPVGPAPVAKEVRSAAKAS